jgi:hypothetical protein
VTLPPFPLVNWQSPRKSILTPHDPEELAQLVVANAVWAEGLRAGVPEEKDKFQLLLGNPPVNAAFDLDNGFSSYTKDGKTYYRGTSTCGLVAEGILESSGLKTPWRKEPYSFKVGKRAIERACSWAMKTGLWATSGPPESGDYVVIGSGMGTHAFICLGMDGDDVWSIDGGQLDPEHRDKYGVAKQMIRKVVRPYRERKIPLIGNKTLVGRIRVRLAPEKGQLYMMAFQPLEVNDA